jgi:tRNA splicing ligase
MGGFEENEDIYRLFIFTDNQFHLDATCSVLRDTVRKHFGHLELSEMPFNSLGGLIDDSFNYRSSVDGKRGRNLSRIEEVQVIHNSQDMFQRNTDKVNIEIFTAIVDVTVSSFRYPRI